MALRAARGGLPFLLRGSRPPAQAAQASASQKLTPTTGWLGPFQRRSRQSEGSMTASSCRHSQPASDHHFRSV